MGSRALKNRRGVKKRKALGGVVGFLGILGIALVSFILCGIVMVNVWLTNLPDYRNASAFNTALPTIVYANDGETEIARFELEHRIPVELDEVSPLLVNATIATEDVRYYEHSGIDIAGIIRALFNNLTGGKIEGASTITQQFVRNTILSGERDQVSLERKVREAYIAIQLEKYYSKDEVLQMYLNTINYGSGSYGIEAAAHHYFSKSADELTLAEAALLAGIPQSPTYNDPTLYPDHALDRRNLVLNRMLTNGFITQEEYDAAVAEPIELDISEWSESGIVAYPYFASYVRYLLYNDFDLTEAEILKGGLTVYTTLDVDTQEAAEAAVEQKREWLPGQLEVALAAVDPKTGNILAIVGGSDFEDSQVNIATGQGGYGRPCGSAFKIFTLTTAIKKGIDPYKTYVDCDSPATVDGYRLTNYANIDYGVRTIASAFAVSSNTGFVRLISAVGVSDTAQTAHDLGITSDLQEDTAGAALTLGVQNVTPLEMANAIATIANGGVRHEPCAVTKILDRDGNVIRDYSDPEARATRVLSPEEAYAVQQVMKGVVSNGTGTAAALPSGQPVAGKTGTSENYKDILFAGITPQLAAVIWIGDPTNMTSVPDGTTAADVFRWFASEALADSPIEDFPDVGFPSLSAYTNEHYDIYGDAAYAKKKKDKELKEELEKFKPGEMKEKDLEGMYPGYTVKIVHEFSDKYEEGVVISQSLNIDTQTITVVVSKGKDPTKEKPSESSSAASPSGQSPDPSGGGGSGTGEDPSGGGTDPGGDPSGGGGDNPDPGGDPSGGTSGDGPDPSGEGGSGDSPDPGGDLGGGDSGGGSGDGSGDGGS